MTEQLLSEGLIGGLGVDTGRMGVNIEPEYQPLIGNLFFFERSYKISSLVRFSTEVLIEDVLTFGFGSQ